MAFSFDKAKVIADFFSLSLDQLWVEHLKDLVDAGELQMQKKNLAEGVNLPNPTVCMMEMTIENTLQPVALGERSRLHAPWKFLASNKYFWTIFIVYNAILAVYAYDSALFRLWLSEE